jgi:hypothetical protein
MAERDSARGGVYRWWVPTALSGTLNGGCVVISVYSFAGGIVTRMDVSTAIVKVGVVLLGAYGVYGVWRAGRFGVAVDRDGLRVRDVWRDSVAAWSDITDVAIGKAPFLFRAVYVPLIKVAGGRSSIQVAPMVEGPRIFRTVA